MKQVSHETLQEYIIGLSKDAIQIDNLDLEVYIFRIKYGTRLEPFLNSISKNPPLNRNDLWQRTKGFVEVEMGRHDKRQNDCEQRAPSFNFNK